MRSRAARRVGLALLLGLVGIWTYASLFADVDALLSRQQERRFRAAREHQPSDMEVLRDAGRPFHHGAPPCYAYAAPKDYLADQAEIAQIHAEVLAAGFRPADIASASMVWNRWSWDDETSRHGETTDEELMAEFDAIAGPYERVMGVLARRRIAKALQGRMNAAIAAHERSFQEGDRWLRSLAVERQAALRSIWERHRRALALGNNGAELDTWSVASGETVDAGTGVSK